MALMVWFMALELKGIGGTDYTSNLTGAASGGLLGDAVQLAGTMDEDQIQTAELTIQLNNAIASGATTAESIQTRMQEIKCLINVPCERLEIMYLTLLCKLGVHKSYPQ